jgi:hypothetical protein
MANFIGAIENFNPYIQQIPTEAYTKVGMFKEQQYEAGVQNIQNAVDRVAGLDIANEGGREYLRARVGELTNSLNKYSTVDFSNPNNVSQLVGLARPLYQDENIVNDVINTGVYRKWSKDANEAFKAGKMELGQYARESADVSKWLGSKSAGAEYTGRSTPNLATKKDLVDRIVKAKKDAFERNEYVYDRGYDIERPYYIKSTNKHYSEADFNNFVTESLMSTKDREVLMNEHWYENQGVPIEVLQKEDINLYQAKIDSNLKRIEEIKNDPLLYAGDKKTEAQQVINGLELYNKQLKEGKIKFLQELNLADPTSRDVFHRDLGENRFMNSLGVLRDEVKKEEYVKNEQWFEDKRDAIEAAKNSGKVGTTTGTGKKKTVEEKINEVALFTPVDPNAPKTELSLNVIQSGWQIKNTEINNTMNGLIGKLQENGIDLSEFVSGWDQVQVGGKAGAAMNVPRFKDQAAKDKFYNMVAGLNFAYTKEAEDGHLDNQSFTKWIKENFTEYKDEDPNSKFTFGDKIVSDAMNTMKGTSALLPKLEKIFADKGITRSLAQIDEAIKNKKDMANAYREALLKSGVLSKEEMVSARTISDDDLLDQNYVLDKEREKKKYGNEAIIQYDTIQDKDGTWSVVQNVYEKDKSFWKFLDATDRRNQSVGKLKTSNVLSSGFKTKEDATMGINDGALNHVAGISKKAFTKAEEFVRNTYSYVQENLVSTVVNLKNDESAYNAVKDGLLVFLQRGRLQSTPNDIQIDGIDNPADVSGFSDMEVRGAVISNTEDIFNPNPMYEIAFKGVDKEGKPRNYTGRVSVKSFLATNPNYKTTEYAQYFAPFLYAEKDAYARIKATINPIEGSQGSYANRDDMEPVYNRINQQGKSTFVYDDPNIATQKGNTSFGNDIQWETIPVEKNGKQTMVSYQVVSLGQNTNLGNIKNKDGNTYAPGAYYIKMKIPTSNGGQKVIFLKRPSGESYSFNSASNAHYTIRDLIFNNSDINLDEIDPKTGEVNYFTTDPTTIRGIFNSQLSFNGFSKLESVKIKDALGKEIEKQQAKELQYAR